MQMNQSYPESACISPLAERSVPLVVRLAVLFGGPANLFGWFFFGFGMVFVWLFACRSDVTSWYRFKGPLETVQGQVISSTRTDASQGRRRSGRIYRYTFSYLVDDREYQGASYAVGQQLQAGSSVTVEFPIGKPTVARIRSMRTNVFGPGVLFVLVFPLVGLCVVYFGFISGLKTCSLLRCGVLTSAKLVSKEPTNISVNRRMLYKFIFSFTTSEGRACTASDKTTAERFENGNQEPIIYDPRRPESALLLAGLPAGLQIGDDGQIVNRRPAAAIVSCVIPLVCIVGHGFWGLWLLSH
jgi:hypothetical protein